MVRPRKSIWLYLLMLFFIFGLTAQALGADPEKPAATTKFKDVAISDSNALYIVYVSQRGFISGFPDGSFRPAEGLTRAQAATVMVKAAGLKTGDAASKYKDVGAAHWAAAYIGAASKAGYLSGFPDGTFHPDEKLTRAQAMSILMRLCTSEGQEALPQLEDMKASHWAANAMANALAAGMTGLSADGKKAYPDAEISRAGLARALAILMTKDPGLYKAPLYGTVSDISGNVTLIRNGKESVANDKLLLAQGDTLKTGEKSGARINYPDGSSTLMDTNSEIYIKTSAGRSYIKTDGTPGTAVDFLNVDLKAGTLFGALATKHEGEGKAQSKLSSATAALPSFKYLAANTQASPWYKTAEEKKVKVKVDMPWGVAAVRGTYIKASVFADGTCKVSCLTGSAEVSGGSGSSVPLGQGQSSSVTGQGQAAGTVAGLSADDKAAFQQVQGWVMQTAVNMDLNQSARETQAVMDATVQVPDTATKETTIQTVINALQSSGIQLNTQVIQSIKDQIQNLQNNETLQQQLNAATSTNQNSTNNTRSNNDSGSSIAVVNYSAEGVYGPADGAAATTMAGNANILVAGVTLRNMIITGDLTLAAGIGNGDVTLSNVTVRGNTYVYGGGSSSVHLVSSNLVNVIVDRENNTVRLVASGNTTVGSLLLNSSATLEESGITASGSGFSSVATGVKLPQGAKIILSGNFDNINVTVPGLEIEVASGSIGSLAISSAAAGCSVALQAGTTVGQLEVNAALTVSGSGDIKTAVIKAPNVVLEKAPETLTVAEGITAKVAGTDMTGISTNTAPTTPNIQINPSSNITETTSVTITASATDPDGDTITYTWTGRTAETSTYSAGTHTVTVYATDEHGKESQSATATFTVTSTGTGNNAPTTPTIRVSPESGITVDTDVTITASSTDPDGDSVTYEWTNRDNEKDKYSVGLHTVSVIARDVHGLASPAATYQFVVLSSNSSSGGMMLNGPESRIYANGIAGANITGYSFNVPPVSGHYGQDYAWVKGLNAVTHQWERLDFGYTENGITFSRTITNGQLYNRLEFYYYTNHNCMYGKSNIVYSVNYASGNISVSESAPVANNVAIVKDGTTLVGCYDYNDANGDLEGVSTYQWYSANEPSGTPVLISGETGRTYAASDTKYYFFKVTPVALTGLTGTTTGSAVQSIGTTPSAAVDALSAEITALRAMADADGLFKALNRLNRANVKLDNKTYYLNAKTAATSIASLNDIQTNIVLAGNNAAAVPRADGIRIYTSVGSGTTTATAEIYVVNQNGDTCSGVTSGITVAVTGGTITGLTKGTLTSGTFPTTACTLNTDSYGSAKLTLTLNPVNNNTMTISATKAGLASWVKTLNFSVGWTELGGGGLAAASGSPLSLTTSSGTPYVAYGDAGSSPVGKAIVKYATNTTSWNPVGAVGFSVYAAQEVDLVAVSNNNQLCAVNSNGQLSVIKWNGTAWADYDAVHPSTGTSPSMLQLEMNNSAKPILTFADTVDGYVYGVARINIGSGWVPYCSTEAFATSPQCIASAWDTSGTGSLYVAYYNSAEGKIYVKKPGASDWETVGTAITVPSFNSACGISLKAYNNTVYIAYVDSNGLQVAMYSGSAWATSAPFTTGTIGNYPVRFAIDPSYSAGYVCFADNTGKVYVKKYDTGTWNSLEAGSIFTTAGKLDLAVYNQVPYVAYTSTDGKVHLMKYFPGAGY